MKKSTKTLLKAACGIGAVGLVLILIGAGMGATWEDARREGKWAVTDRDLELFSEGSAQHDPESESGSAGLMTLTETEQLRTEDVAGLEFDIEAAEILVEVWDENYVSIRTDGRLNHYRAKLNGDGIYEMESDAGLTKNQGTLAVYLPENMVLTSLELEIRAGEAKISQVTAKRVSADVGAGALTFEGTILGNAEFECGAGETIVHLNGNPQDYNYDLSCKMGELVLNGESYGGIARDQRIDNRAMSLIRLECGVGRIELNVSE